MERDELVKYRETFLSLAEMVDEMLYFYDKKEAGEEVDEKQFEALLGRFMISVMKLQGA